MPDVRERQKFEKCPMIMSKKVLSIMNVPQTFTLPKECMVASWPWQFAKVCQHINNECTKGMMIKTDILVNAIHSTPISLRVIIGAFRKK